MNFETFHTTALIYAEKYFLESHSLPTTILADLPDNKIFILNKEEDGLFTRDRILDLYAGLLLVRESSFYTVVTEARFATSLENDVDEDNFDFDKLENIRDCLHVLSIHKDGRKLLNMYEVVRDNNIRLENIEIDHSAEIGGTIATLFTRFDYLPGEVIKHLMKDLLLGLPLFKQSSWHKEFTEDDFLRGRFDG